MPARAAADAAPALEIADLRLTLAGGRPVVDGVDLTIATGGVHALVGESGSGKTLIGRAILRLLPPAVNIAGGTIRIAGQDVLALSPRGLRRLRGAVAGMVFQEPLVSLNPAHTVGRQLAEGLRLHTRLSRAQIHQRMVAMLARIGMGDPERCLASFPHAFSGGMRQRILLAGVMLLEPRLLIADEPTTALDTLTQRDVMETMAGLTRATGTAVLLITHNLGLVARYADGITVLREGRRVEAGPVRQVLQQPGAAYTRSLIAALPRPRAPRPPPADPTPVLAAEGVGVSFTQGGGLLGPGRQVTALGGVSLAIAPGEVVALVGGSGSGKTTLGRALLRLQPVTTGRILHRGRDITRLQPSQLRDFRRDVQVVFQDPFSALNPRLPLARLVGEALRLRPQLDPQERDERVEAALAAVGLAGMGRRLPHALSGGQRQRVAIARAIVAEPAVVIADEPISALDLSIQAQILDLVAGLQQSRGFACLFISHDLAAVEQIADRLVVLQGGQVVEQGPTRAVFDAPQHPYTQALLEASLAHLVRHPRRAEGQHGAV